MKCYRIEVKLNKKQIEEYYKTIGVCRFVYNLYLSTNKERYEKGLSFLSSYDFSKYLNNDYRKEHPENSWIQDVSSKAIMKSIINANNAFKRFFKKVSKFPKYKKKGSRECGFYLIGQGNCKGFTIKRNKIKVPILGCVTLKEFGYIPKNTQIVSATLKRQANKYYISFITKNVTRIKENIEYEDYGIGLDLGIYNLAVTSDGRFYSNINKDKSVIKIEKRLKRIQRKLSKQLLLKNKNIKEGKSYKNIEKTILKLQKLHVRLTNIRDDYIRKVVYSIIKPKDKYVKFITLEDLNVKGMMKNKHISKAVSNQKFYYFKKFLIDTCNKYNIEVREADRFYPSSKTCSKCGYIHKELKRNDRIYVCPKCNHTLDRDLNASINLKNLKEYKIIN